MVLRKTYKKFRGGRPIESLTQANKQDIAENFLFNLQELSNKNSVKSVLPFTKENTQLLVENMNQTFLDMWDKRSTQKELTNLKYLEQILIDYWPKDDDDSLRNAYKSKHWWEKEEYKPKRVSHNTKKYHIT